jgi:hypothetical protein
VNAEAKKISVIIQAVDIVAKDVAKRHDAHCTDDLELLSRLRATLTLELQAATRLVS